MKNCAITTYLQKYRNINFFMKYNMVFENFTSNRFWHNSRVQWYLVDLYNLFSCWYNRYIKSDDHNHKLRFLFEIGKSDSTLQTIVKI